VSSHIYSASAGQVTAMPRSVEVHQDARTGDSDARVKLCGEHDLATREAVRAALAPLVGVVVVDLLDCDFVDVTVYGALLDKADELDRLGSRLELRIPHGESAVARLLELMGSESRLPVHVGRFAA
jgi:anti-anti-sigma regulatory factor